MKTKLTALLAAVGMILGVSLIAAPSASAATYITKTSICSNVWNLGSTAQWEQQVKYVRSVDSQGRAIVRLGEDVAVVNRTQRGVYLDIMKFRVTNHSSGGDYLYGVSGRTQSNLATDYTVFHYSGSGSGFSDVDSSRRIYFDPADGRASDMQRAANGLPQTVYSNSWNTAGSSPYYHRYVLVSENPGFEMHFTTISTGAQFSCRTTLN